MNACVCGHPAEDHPSYGACTESIVYRGKVEPCRCVPYEEDAGG